MLSKEKLLFVFLFWLLPWQIHGQIIPAGYPVLEEVARRQNLIDEGFKNYSFALRPVRVSEGNLFFEETAVETDSIEKKVYNPKKWKTADFKILPVMNTSVYNSNRPFGWGNSAMLNGAGWQNLLSFGIFARLSVLQIQISPEFVNSQNSRFQGYGGSFFYSVNFERFRYWNYGDNPEYFGDSYANFVTPGQSFISLNLGKVEAGVGTQNIWWGPGQFTSLIFSNNARGMPHAFLRTSAPVNIGIGHLEGEIIAGRAEDSGLKPSQNSELNNSYFRDFSGDWRYVSGISITYQPSFLKGFFLGFNRTFQQYNENVESTLQGRFPIFESFQKEKFFEDGHSVAYDGLAQDQQVSVFFKFKIPKGKFEFYSEFGKRDHSYNWREFILNPEHARAYLFGFTKLITLSKSKSNEFLQIRGEVIHQSESINRYIRYEVVGSYNATWHTHHQVRGFTNYGEAMGVGIGVGANAQILEIAKVNNLNKLGLLFQRIENHQDFYYGAFGDNPERQPWIDFSLGLLWDQQWNRFIVSSKVQFIKGRNYQWQTDSSTSVDFPSGENLNSFSAQVSLIYSLYKR
ncbi:hypothetical protein GCM10009119_38750 [Algoriphagus jejuensis]|uniref:Capsule assembly protein Wzi n=1 Tax=Algoriphagus jejuensis TaxID=419934 RepID=A0ABP3YKG5_9BACT